MIETGFEEFDREFGGIPEGITLVSAKAGSCKTIASLTMSNYIYMTTELELAYLSWEHDHNNICAMQAASLSGVNWLHIAVHRDKLTATDKEKLELSLKSIRERNNIYRIYGSLDSMTANIIAVKYKSCLEECNLVFLDSLGMLITGYDETKPLEDTYRSVLKKLREKSIEHKVSFVIAIDELKSQIQPYSHIMREHCDCWLRLTEHNDNTIDLLVDTAPKRSNNRTFKCWFNVLTQQVKNPVPKGVL